MDAEQAETYLRLAAESALRSADRAAGAWDWPRGLMGVTFYATLSPAIPTSASCVEVLVTGQTAEARATVPLTWWLR